MSIAYKTLAIIAAITLFGATANAKDRAELIAPTSTKTEVISTEVQKTTATSYTLSTRKVGLVGGRPYKAKTQELEGGVSKETIVNGVQTSNEVIVPDRVAPLAETVRDEDYFTNRARDAQVYEQMHSNVHVRNIGRLNR